MKLTKKKFIAGLMTLAMAVTVIGLPLIARAADRVATGGACKYTSDCASKDDICAADKDTGTKTCTVSADTNLGDDQTANLTNFQTASGLGGGDLTTMIGSIIKVALSLLGVVAVLIILYGGFRWMISNGDETKVGDAKKLIIAGIIGLIIIIAAYAIASFVITNLISATT